LILIIAKNAIFEVLSLKYQKKFVVANRVKLSVLGISFSQVQAGAYALILAEENGVRRLPIVIGTPEAQSIALVIENITPPRPLSHDLIHSIFKHLNIELVEVFIYKFENGAFYSELLLRQYGQEYRIDSRTSDAVAIAMRTHSPIYTTEEIMKNMAIVFEEGVSAFSGEQSSENEEEKVPDDLSHLRLDTLKSRLDEAVREENYELASRLRDEIKRRENKS